jgi:hypothetical protein
LPIIDNGHTIMINTPPAVLFVWGTSNTS